MIVGVGMGALGLGASPARASGPSIAPDQQTEPSEKASRTAAQRKINSRLLYEIYRRQGLAAAKQVPPGDTGVKTDAEDRALVDVRVDITPAFQKKVAALGGAIVSTSIEYRSIVAWFPVLKLEQLAEDRAVYAIEPAAEATTNRQPLK